MGYLLGKLIYWLLEGIENIVFWIKNNNEEVKIICKRNIDIFEEKWLKIFKKNRKIFLFLKVFLSYKRKEKMMWMILFWKKGKKIVIKCF